MIHKVIVGADGSIEHGLFDFDSRYVVYDPIKDYVRSLYIEKVNAQAGETMAERVTPFLTDSIASKCMRLNPDKFLDYPDERHSLRCLVKITDDGGWYKYIDETEDFGYDGKRRREDTITLSKRYIQYFRCAFNSAGDISRAMRVEILTPGDIAFARYICTCHGSESEAYRCRSYLTSDFYRAGLASNMLKWNLYRQKHCLLPAFDLIDCLIDWSSDVSVSDQLYSIYKFDSCDVQHIHKFLRNHERSLVE